MLRKHICSEALFLMSLSAWYSINFEKYRLNTQPVEMHMDTFTLSVFSDVINSFRKKKQYNNDHDRMGNESIAIKSPITGKLGDWLMFIKEFRQIFDKNYSCDVFRLNRRGLDRKHWVLWVLNNNNGENIKHINWG